MAINLDNRAETMRGLADQRLVHRSVVVVALGGIALIHLLDVPDKIQEVPYVGVLFLGLIVTCLGLAAVLASSNDRRAWLGAAAVSAMTIIGYAVSRTVGLPGDGGADIDNWSEPLGLASLMVEGCVVLLAAVNLRVRR